VDGLLTGTAPTTLIGPMCNLYSITTNQAAIIALFRVINRFVGKGRQRAYETRWRVFLLPGGR
jgi:hypothetical protein